MTAMEKEDKLANARAAGQCTFEHIAELVDTYIAELIAELVNGDDEKAREDAEQAIHEHPLTVEVRGDWHAPGTSPKDTNLAEYRILCSTGGPAVQIVGELNEWCEPVTARMQVQDWFQPWTDMRFTDERDADGILLAYAQHFYFGG